MDIKEMEENEYHKWNGMTIHKCVFDFFKEHAEFYSDMEPWQAALMTCGIMHMFNQDEKGRLHYMACDHDHVKQSIVIPPMNFEGDVI